ncbi:MAG: MBL fold metallo-hydrolase [Tannerella sp.]|jgi:glyoxylase-like metal-dependent hydrolase (beta-lactamase superfamily II)|nr:MBL fold metallo-hydrolase [Tannerella sp.]
MITVKQFVFNYFGENTYLLYDETREAALIDCGCMTRGEENTLSAFIDEERLTLKRLLCTHYHLDHAIGNAFIFRKYGVKPELHQVERLPDIPTLAMQAASFGISTKFDDIEPERFIEDNDKIYFGASALKALLVPGHSPASLAFYSEADNIAFTGDALFNGSIGRTDLWGGNYEVLISSIKSKLLTLPDRTVIYPGHGLSSSISFEKSNNPFFRER